MSARIQSGDLVEIRRGEFNGRGGRTRGIVLKCYPAHPCIRDTFEVSSHGTGYILRAADLGRVVKRRFVSHAALQHL